VSEAVLENPATQVCLEFVDHELGQPACLLGPLTEGRPVLLDQLVEQALLGSTTLIPVGP
jgi:hypothetical protein